MAPVLAAIITLLGTLAVGAIGFWQWRRTQSVSERKEYREKRIETLRILWEALNKIEEDQRSKLTARGVKRRQLQQEQLRKVNLILMKSAPFLLDDEREWSISIVQHIIEIDTALRVQENQGKLSEDWWHTTAVPPPTATVTSIAGRKLYIAREALASRYAAVMRGEHG